ncbi:MAG: tRNA (guanosine(37)-N1)-methyltransferase TrmD [Planctomycetia bacterium]|nr:tRNA (guanosine(37)-N1)-methyltransferase TrmD [Planctomycetia bacterium]
MRFEILTLFPEIFRGFLRESLIADAVEAGRVEFRLHQLRDWAYGKHQSVDDRPFGGGPGMVLRSDVVVPAVESIQTLCGGPGSIHTVFLSPQGQTFDQTIAERFATLPAILLVCGRYEGFDERISEILHPEEISIGDFVLNGGEVAAMAVIEATFRLLPGSLGDELSSVQDSFSGEHRWLDCPQYTRPRSYRGLEVPEVLLSGNHAAVDAWRESVRIERTFQRRPDLFERYGYPPPPPVRRNRRNRRQSPEVPTEPLPSDPICDTMARTSGPGRFERSGPDPVSEVIRQIPGEDDGRDARVDERKTRVNGRDARMSERNARMNEREPGKDDCDESTDT